LEGQTFFGGFGINSFLTSIVGKIGLVNLRPQPIFKEPKGFLKKALGINSWVLEKRELVRDFNWFGVKQKGNWGGRNLVLELRVWGIGQFFNQGERNLLRPERG